MATIDYTKKRKGTATRDGVIGVCPKCGRKGAYHVTTFVRTGVQVADYHHQIEVDDSTGIAFRVIRDHCGAGVLTK